MRLAINPSESFEKIFKTLITMNKIIKKETGEYFELPETPIRNITESNKHYLISHKNEIYPILANQIKNKNKYQNLIQIIEEYYPKDTWENQIPKLNLCQKLINKHMDLF